MTPLPVLRTVDLEGDAHVVLARYRRSHALVARDDGATLVLQAAAVRRLANDKRLISPDTLYVPAGPLFDFVNRMMLFSNGEVHSRRRGLFRRMFSAPVIEQLRPEARRAADRLIDGWAGRRQVELAESFASPLATLIICKLLGVAVEDLPPNFLGLVASVMRFLSIGHFDKRDIPQIERDIVTLLSAVEQLLEARRRAPRDDALTAFVVANNATGELSREEVVAQIVVLFLAATDTLRLSLTTQIVLLLSHPDQWEAVCRDESLRRPAVHECLRFEPSVASYYRVPLEPIEIGGRWIAPNSLVMLSAQSALRDEAVYSAPDRFDIFRTDHPKGHLAFSGGPHGCLGYALALLQLEEGLGALSSRLPRLRLVGPPPVPRGHSGIRRLGPAHVAWS